MTGKARVAIIGLGYFSQFHLAAWTGRDDAEVVAATDLDPARRDWAAAEYGVPVCDDAGAALALSPDIVDVIAPPPAHASLIRAALAAGRIIICQKPFCQSLEEAVQITAEAEAAGTTLVIHENFRFQPWHRAIGGMLAEGLLGEVWGARFDLRPGDGRGPRAYLDRQPAFQTMPRLLIHETAVHFVDLFRWFFGDITAVYADLRRLNPAIAGEDAGLLVLEHDSGARSLFDGNRLADHASDNPRRTMGEMEIVGARGTLRLDGYARGTFRPFGELHETPLDLPTGDPDSFGGGCVAALIGHVAALRTTPDRIENRARDYLPVIAAVEAAYRSAETGCREVPVIPLGTPG